MLKAQFEAIIADIRYKFLNSPSVPVKSWQSVAAPQPMPEIFNYSFTLDLKDLCYSLPDLRDAIKPNLPWADEHFTRERISGQPINPGETWRIWPYSRSADTHRREGEKDPQFDHSYAERYWPRQAGLTEGGRLGKEGGVPPEHHLRGIRFRYGDLNDLVELMGNDPLTRQGYLPIWFPEDLAAAVEGKRVPCTLGYHFIRRDGRLHCIYPMRSCDFIRHFRDDVYLTIRLQIHLLSILTFRFPELWGVTGLGTFTMHITSLHCFENDRDLIRKSFEG